MRFASGAKFAVLSFLCVMALAPGSWRATLS